MTHRILVYTPIILLSLCGVSIWSSFQAIDPQIITMALSITK